ncbi:uncharacterized protein LOC142224962 [Haematobia irritans]|uniref:uncharacterized protein LOC142224962 n=1 Tax=Haematobia irritans TaxID=7368 RepID=UPI003F4F5994
MNKKINNIVKQCTVCRENKYDRHPPKHELRETPIPTYPGEIIHIDIYRTEKQLVLTAIDKFSKYAQGKLIKSRAIEDIKEPLRKLIFSYGVPKMVVFDNEPSLNSATITFMLQDQLGIKIFRAPPYASTVNGQVERFHSTLTEIMRCLKSERTNNAFIELLDRAIYEYNYTIHSTTGQRPLEVFFGRRVSTDPEAYERTRQDNIQRLKDKQAIDLKNHNKNREPIKQYKPGDVIYVKVNKRLGTKLSPKFKREVLSLPPFLILSLPFYRTLLTLHSSFASELQVLNHTLSHLVAINDGQGRVQNGTFKIIHIVELHRYWNLTNNIRTEIETTIPNSNPFYPLLIHEYKRAINILGTAWKYIAGSPDHDDYELISNTLNESLKNINQQVLINEIFTERLRNLTDITNKINNSIKKSNKLINEAAISLQIKLRFVKEELINIRYAIEWAKQNVINSVLLNKEEIKKTLSKLVEDKFSFSSVEQALELSNVKVLYNKKKIMYVIVVPLMSNKVYTDVILKPVKRNGKIVNVKYKEIMKNNNEIYGILNACPKVNDVKICKLNQLVNISKDNCIPPLLSGRNSSCTMSQGYHIPNVEIISPGVVLLNDFNGTINNETISGTYLIKFHNVTVKINNKFYRNLEAPHMEVSPPSIQQFPIENEFVNLLSLEMLNYVHINNTKKIHEIKSDFVTTKYINFSIFILLFLLFAIINCFSKKREKIVFQTVTPNPKAIQQIVQPNFQCLRPQKVDDLPYF